MPRVGFEPTIPMFERAKTVHALDRAATVIGYYSVLGIKISKIKCPAEFQDHNHIRPMLY
jgi:hypothetical protein